MHHHYRTSRIDDPVTGRARVYLDELRRQVDQERLARLVREHTRAAHAGSRLPARQIVDHLRSPLAGFALHVRRRTAPLAE